MDAKERTRLRALCEAATPGPWDAIYDEDAGEWMVRTGHADVAVLTWQQALDALGLSPVTMRTAAFIAASRTAIPALLDDSERLDAVTRERDEARAEAERLRTEVAAAVVVERETCAVICENAAGAEASMGDAERAEGDDEHADARMTRASALRQVARAIRARGAGGAR